MADHWIMHIQRHELSGRNFNFMRFSTRRFGFYFFWGVLAYIVYVSYPRETCAIFVAGLRSMPVQSPRLYYGTFGIQELENLRLAVWPIGPTLLVDHVIVLVCLMLILGLFHHFILTSFKYGC